MMESDTRNVITVVFKKTNAVRGLLQRVSKITSELQRTGIVDGTLKRVSKITSNLQEVGRVTAVITRVDFGVDSGAGQVEFTFLILSDDNRVVLTDSSQLVLA